MNCQEATPLLNAHLDGELGLEPSLAVEQHVETCAACRRAVAKLQATRRVIARHAAPPPAPGELRVRVEHAARPIAAGRLGEWLRAPALLAAPGVVALALAGWMFFTGPRPPAPGELRIVYHISESANARAALRNLSNHLRAAPEARVVVVAHNNGVDFLLAGAVDEAGEPFAPAVRAHRRRGVEFRVCHNTLERRGITQAALVPEAMLVPSGIAEISRLQVREGFAYMRL